MSERRNLNLMLRAQINIWHCLEEGHLVYFINNRKEFCYDMMFPVQLYTPMQETIKMCTRARTQEQFCNFYLFWRVNRQQQNE